MDKKIFRCPMRDHRAVSLQEYEKADRRNIPYVDFWDQRGRCSYCGSIHPETFIRYCKKVIEEKDLSEYIDCDRRDNYFLKIEKGITDKVHAKHIELWILPMDADERIIILGFIRDALKVSCNKRIKLENL